MKKTKVISGFPGVGKSFLTEKAKKEGNLIVLDSDSSKFSWIEKGVRHPDFPANYIRHIQENIGKADYIMVSSHDIVRDALKMSDIHYFLVYPEKEAKFVYLDRYQERGSEEAFIRFIDSQWEFFLEGMEDETFPTKIQLRKFEHLEDVLDMVRLGSNKRGKYGGVEVNVSQLDVGTKFYVCNGNWEGEVISVDGQKKIRIEGGDVISLKEDHGLDVQLLEGI